MRILNGRGPLSRLPRKRTGPACRSRSGKTDAGLPETEEHETSATISRDGVVVVEDLDAWKLVPPKGAQLGIIAENHDPPEAGHLGGEKTAN
ncbi:hypothetical protein KQX54_010473 [Cotesia glomerata]|uniref:Uncharacterized protein n=1 Tax=Cotesia glomerata TaxID=32391 RepID=A0AAV7HY10_COTGL|nr:hypothetical protein KQX54_010473 [Cotesia glomerata]